MDYKKSKPGKTPNTRSDKAIFKDHPEGYTGCDFFVQIEYRDTNSRTKHEKVKNTTCIIFENRNSTITVMDFSSQYCLDEYIEQFKQWDRVTPFAMWCTLNYIPWERFRRGISKTQIRSSFGSFAVVRKQIIKRKHANKPTAANPRPKQDKIYRWDK